MRGGGRSGGAAVCGGIPGGGSGTAHLEGEVVGKRGRWRELRSGARVSGEPTVGNRTKLVSSWCAGNRTSWNGI